MKLRTRNNSILAIFVRISAAAILLIAMLGSVAITPANAATITVPDNYSTIQAAVNAAAAGDSIYVRAGTYPEHVTISKTLTLTGENKATTIVDGGGSATLDAITVSGANNVYISGFTVQNALHGIQYSVSNNGHIQDVLAQGNSEAGIFLQQSNYNVVENSTATGSVMGINLGDHGSSHNTIHLVTTYSNTESGITGYSNSNNTTISNCIIHDNPKGVTIGWSQYWDVEDSTFYSNGTGIYMDTASYVTVRHNDFHSNIQGMRFTGYYGYNALIEENSFYQNTSSGVALNNDAHSNIIRSNDFYNNQWGVVIPDAPGRQSDGNTFYQNSFIGNTVNAKIDSATSSNTWDNGYPNGGNYWDTYNGGDIYHGSAQDVAGRDGVGDTPYVLVTTTNIDRYPLKGLYAANDGPAFLGNPINVTASTLLTRAFTYSWTFGDGTSGTGAAAAHTYAASGPFTATCTASFGAIALTGSTIVTIIYVPHTNANLSSLVFSTGTLTPVFATGTVSYTQALGNAVTSLTVTPTVADATATVTVNGSPVVSGNASSAIALTVGDNIITTVVTAEDNTTTKTYTVTVTRAASANANLSSLVFSTGALTPGFATNTLTYAQAVGNAVTSLTVTPTVADATATVTVNGSSVVSGNASSAIALAVGDNTITTVVTAQDHTTTKTYTVTVTRAASTNANLSNLVLSTGALTPVFATGTVTYTQSVDAALTSLTVTPTKADATATITVNGSPVVSGSPSGAIALAKGLNLITVVVTAQDSVTTKTYTVTVTRPFLSFLPVVQK